MKCESCRFINDDNSKFCSNCGNELASRKSKQANAKPKLYSGKKKINRNVHSLKSNTPNLKPLWITVGVVIVSILIAISFDLAFHKYPDRNSFQGDVKSSNPVVEDQVTAIASKFICSCGTKECANQSLETCTCDIAAKERKFIRTGIEQSANGEKKPGDIVIALANEYGNLKPEFASKYKVNSSKVWRSR